MTEPDSYNQSNQTIAVNGIELHYALDGEPDKPLLALVNMASHNLTCWEGVLDALLRHHRVLRFDIRGTGKSGWGADEQFTFSQYADDLAGLMDALALDRAFVLGVAYGARTAARFALHHPERLNALGLFDVSLIPPVEQGGQRALGAEARKLLEAAGTPAPDPKKSWRFYEDREAARKAHTAHEREPDITPDMAQVSAPTLVVCGRQDQNLGEAERIADVMPNARFEVMEMTGHGSPFFRPDLFAQLINDFSETLP